MPPDKSIYTNMLDVLIVDDHKMIRDGLKMMLSSFKHTYRFHMDEAENGNQAIKKINRKSFHLVIIDYHMPDMTGADAITRMLRYKPDLKVLALSNYDELPYIQSMIDAGAKGYVLKNIEPAQMLQALKNILENKIYYSNEVAMKLLEGAQKENTIKWTKEKGLTKREIEVLKLIALEMTNEEIALKLKIAKRTVDSHRQNLLLKLQVKNTVGLIKAAYKLNLIH